MRQHNLFWGSSYDRGLEHLLKMWPKVKEAYPDAELHICYGWQLFDVAYSNNPERMAWKEKMAELMKTEGITHHGRIGKQGLHKVREQCGIWAYPTHFTEINCITALECQRDGLVPCVINLAALKETVGSGVKVEGDIYDPETKEAYLKALLALMGDGKRWKAEQAKGIESAKAYDWTLIARKWAEVFEGTIEDQVMWLIYQDEGLQAYELAKKHNLPIAAKLYKQLEHLFKPEKYGQYYGEQGSETNLVTDVPSLFNAHLRFRRYAWVLEEARRAGYDSLIDMATNDGALVFTASLSLKRVVGVDMYKRLVDQCNTIAKDTKSQAVFYEGDISQFSLPEKFDAVCAFEVIEHVPDPGKLIQNLLRLKSERGWIYMSTPEGAYDPIASREKYNPDMAYPMGHVRTYTVEKLEELLKGHECVINRSPEGLLLFKFR